MRDQFALTLITAPVGEPLTLAEVKDHLKCFEEVEDSYIERLIKTAREHLEERDDRRLLTQVWELAIWGFPYCGAIEIPYWPVQSITWIKYVNENGDEITLDPADYHHYKLYEISYIRPAYNKYWPTSRYFPDSVRVRFNVGYGDPETVEDPAFDGTNYQLIIETNWMTPIGITAKTANGFTIEFGNAAPSDGSGRVKYQAVAGTPRQVLIDSEAEIDANALEQEIEFATTIPTPSTIVGGIPEPLKQALRLHIGHMFENREDTIAGVSLQTIPRGYDALIGANRRIHV